jgi:hypothetical protein
MGTIKTDDNSERRVPILKSAGGKNCNGCTLKKAKIPDAEWE